MKDSQRVYLQLGGKYRFHRAFRHSSRRHRIDVLGGSLEIPCLSDLVLRSLALCPFQVPRDPRYEGPGDIIIEFVSFPPGRHFDGPEIEERLPGTDTVLWVISLPILLLRGED